MATQLQARAAARATVSASAPHVRVVNSILTTVYVAKPNTLSSPVQQRIRRNVEQEL